MRARTHSMYIKNENQPPNVTMSYMKTYDLEFVQDEEFLAIILPAGYKRSDYPALRTGSTLVKVSDQDTKSVCYHYLSSDSSKAAMILSTSNVDVESYGTCYMENLFKTLKRCPKEEPLSIMGTVPNPYMRAIREPLAILALLTALIRDHKGLCKLLPSREDDLLQFRISM